MGIKAFSNSGSTRYSAVHDTDSAGDLTVTFPAGLFAGPPVVHLSIVSPLATDQYLAELVGEPTATNAVVKVRKLVGLTLNILSLGLVNLFTTTGIVKVHVRASEAL